MARWQGRTIIRAFKVAALALLAMTISATAAGSADPVRLAAAYGGREAAWGVRISPDGDCILYMTPSGDAGTAVVIADIAAGTVRSLLTSDGKLFDVRVCEWKSAARIICRVAAIRFTDKAETNAVGLVRTLSLAADGSGTVELGAMPGGSRRRC